MVNPERTSRVGMQTIRNEMYWHINRASKLAQLAQIEMARVEERLRIASLLADWNAPSAGRVIEGDRDLFT